MRGSRDSSLSSSAAGADCEPAAPSETSPASATGQRTASWPTGLTENFPAPRKGLRAKILCWLTHVHPTALPASSVEASAHFIFLNKTCFRGMFREEGTSLQAVRNFLVGLRDRPVAVFQRPNTSERKAHFTLLRHFPSPEPLGWCQSFSEWTSSNALRSQ